MYLLPILAALFTALGLVHYKWFLRASGLDSRTILTFQFVFLFLFSLLLTPWYGGVHRLALSPRYLLLFVFLVGLGLVTNYFATRGLRRNTLHEYELIEIILPVFTISLAALTFQDEREPIQLTLGLLGGLSFLIAHIKGSHFQFKQADRWLVYAVFILAVERLLIKPLLLLATPVSLYNLRTGLIALGMLVLFGAHLERLRPWHWLHVAVNALLGVVAMVALWTSIGQLGIVTTELFLLLTPILLASFSLLFFRERWSIRQGLAFFVILVCVGLVSFL